MQLWNVMQFVDSRLQVPSQKQGMHFSRLLCDSKQAICQYRAGLSQNFSQDINFAFACWVCIVS
jgi:hypothetical protein